ncbi:hypothetical protein M9H77_21162 [Catharanthus roseus]|uniref:Uncharacterized protein n=1 Tax=Catharanthus roseus TaxID=4058 RepID=A0ACC0ALZ0_CATRO|nr:hypothetical protein M9H77_21162 [Catharanthus roseus]
MCMDSDLPHDQDEDGMGFKGERPIKRIVGRHSGKEQEQTDLTERRNFMRSGGRKAKEDAEDRVAHFIAESSRAIARLALCCLDHEQQLMRRVEDVVLRVSASFDEHMQWLF